MNDKSERNWIWPVFEVLYRHLPEGSEKSHEDSE